MHAARKILSVDTGLLRTDLQDISLICVSLNTGSRSPARLEATEEY